MANNYIHRNRAQSLNTGGLWSKLMSDAPVDWDSLTFSMTETDHMYITKTAIDEPWGPGHMRPYGNISISLFSFSCAGKLTPKGWFAPVAVVESGYKYSRGKTVVPYHVTRLL